MKLSDQQQRHLPHGRFGRATQYSEVGRGRQRGHWTGYRPLEDVITDARLEALEEWAVKEREDSRGITG